MSKVLVDISNEYGYSILGVEGESLDIGGCALQAPGLTDFELNKTYEKRITMLVEGNYIGFVGVASAVNYIRKVEKTKKITNIIYWGEPDAMNYLKLRFALCKADANDLLWSKKDNEIWPNKKSKEGYLGRVSGVKIGKSVNKYKIYCKPYNN